MTMACSGRAVISTPNLDLVYGVWALRGYNPKTPTVPVRMLDRERNNVRRAIHITHVCSPPLSFQYKSWSRQIRRHAQSTTQLKASMGLVRSIPVGSNKAKWINLRPGPVHGPANPFKVRALFADYVYSVPFLTTGTGIAPPGLLSCLAVRISTPVSVTRRVCSVAQG